MDRKINYHIQTLPDIIDKGRIPTFDDKGVLLECIPYSSELVYNPTMIASFVIRTKSEPNIQWLLDNMEKDGTVRHNYQSAFSPPPGWIGGLSQSLVGSALIQSGHEEEGKRAIDSLVKNCYKNGVIYERPNQIILNGWMYGIFGMYDAGKSIYEPITKLADSLRLFDGKYWSYYSNEWIFAPTFYHNIHIQQLNALYEHSDHEVLLYFYNHWKDDSNKRKALLHRNLQLLKKHKLQLYSQWRKRKKWQKNL